MPVNMRDKKRSYAGYLGTLGSTEDAPANTVAPEIQGDNIRSGDMVIVSRGTWENIPPPVFTYQWKVAGVNVVDATNERYRIMPGDAGKALTVAVTATNTEGATTATSAAVNVWAAPANTDLPTITGTAKVGETLTADEGVWIGVPAPTFVFEWTTDGDVIVGATEATYEPTEDDIGKVIAINVIAVNEMGSAVATSADTDVVVGAE